MFRTSSLSFGLLIGLLLVALYRTYEQDKRRRAFSKSTKRMKVLEQELRWYGGTP